jgi:hypothetical protein
MANLKGLGSIVPELRAERTDLVNQLRQVDAALAVLSKLNGGSSAGRTVSIPTGAANRFASITSRDPGAHRKRSRVDANAGRGSEIVACGASDDRILGRLCPWNKTKETDARFAPVEIPIITISHRRMY